MATLLRQPILPNYAFYLSFILLFLEYLLEKRCSCELLIHIPYALWTHTQLSTPHRLLIRLKQTLFLNYHLLYYHRREISLFCFCSSLLLKQNVVSLDNESYIGEAVQELELLSFRRLASQWIPFPSFF